MAMLPNVKTISGLVSLLQQDAQGQERKVFGEEVAGRMLATGKKEYGRNHCSERESNGNRRRRRQMRVGSLGVVVVPGAAWIEPFSKSKRCPEYDSGRHAQP